MSEEAPRRGRKPLPAGPAASLGQEEAARLQRIRQWDTAALAEVYDEFYDRIYRYIYCYLGRVDSAEDLTASTFTRLLGAVRNGNSPRSNLSAWLYRVAHNLVVDSFRRKPTEDLELAEWLDTGEPDLTHTVEQRLQLERVRAALQELTETQQQVIIFKFLEGMDSREVATILGKTEGAVDALQHRALLALRRTLQHRTGSGAAGPRRPDEGSADTVTDAAVASQQARPSPQDSFDRFAVWLARCLHSLGHVPTRQQASRAPAARPSPLVTASGSLCFDVYSEAAQ